MLAFATAVHSDVLRWYYSSNPEGFAHTVDIMWDGMLLSCEGDPIRNSDGIWSLQTPNISETYEWDVLARNEHGEVMSENGPKVRTHCTGDLDRDGRVGAEDLTLLLNQYSAELTILLQRFGSICL